MKVGIFGSGMVAQTIGGKLAELGHQVKLGTRDPGKLREWQGKAGDRASVGSFAEAAAFGEILFNCTLGSGSLEALGSAAREDMAGKILVDVSNALDFSHGMPPTLFVCNTDSLGEQIQRAYPDTRVVKSLNTCTAPLMVNPAALPGDHDVFVSGNDPEAKAKVTEILEGFGWRSVIDLGDITSARAVEMLMIFWLRMWGVVGGPMFNYRIVR